MKKIIYSYFYKFGIRGQGGIDSMDIMVGLLLLPVAFPIHLIWYFLEGHKYKWDC